MRQFALRRRNVSLIADSYFDAGFTPVIDDIVVGPHIDEYREHLRGRPLLFVMLAPRPDIVRQRETSRNKHVFDAWAHLDEAIRRQSGGVGLIIDTSEQTAEQTADEIIRRADEAHL
jgi:hypothetical protein